MVGEFRVGDVATSLVHCALVTAFQRGDLLVIPETAALVACLVLGLAADNVEDQSVTGNFLVGLDFDDVARLNGAPVGDLEALVALGENELLDGLAVHFFSSLLELFVVKEVEAASGDDGSHSDEDDVRVVCGLTLT